MRTAGVGSGQGADTIALLEALKLLADSKSAEWINAVVDGGASDGEQLLFDSQVHLPTTFREAYTMTGPISPFRVS